MKHDFRTRAERVVEFAASASLAVAAGWSAWMVSGPLLGVVTAIAARRIAILLVRQLGGTHPPLPAKFTPLSFDEVQVAVAHDSDELLLTDEYRGARAEAEVALPDDNELLLDTPLVASAAMARVAQLFGDAPVAQAERDPDAAGTPSAMIARIERHLGQTGIEGARPPVAGDAPEDPRPMAVDARDALHAALSDIRRSLKRA